MGLLIAVFAFAISSMTAIHVGHLHHQNAELNQKVQVLETQEDGVNLQIDGTPIRNLSDE